MAATGAPCQLALLRRDMRGTDSPDLDESASRLRQPKMNANNPPLHVTSTQTQLVHNAMRLLRIVRLRRASVVAAVAVASLLGALYYSTADQLYEARTSLMVLHQGADDSLSGSDGQRNGMLPTYERLLYSSVVLEGAVERLQQLPPEARVDLVRSPREKWVGVLRNNLSARAIRSTNFIEVSYLSLDPDAAVAVVNAVLKSYLAFIEENQKNFATEIVTILDKGRSDVARQLAEKEAMLLAAKREIGDLGLRDGSNVTHPLVHNVVRINEALVETKKERMRLEASELAIRKAISQGRDLRHLMLSMEDAGGRDMVLGMMGLSDQDEDFVKGIERELTDKRAELQSVLQFYGEAHPTIVELREAINQGERYLNDYQTAKARRLNTPQNESLGAMLLSTVHGKLETATTHERQLRREFEIAQEKAIQLNGQVAHVAIVEHDLQMLRELHDTLRNRIANLDIKQDQTEIRLAVVSEAQPNETPVSPHLLAVCVATLFGGLAVGVGVAYVSDVLDDRFRSADELRDQLNVSVLAIVRQLPNLDASGLDSLQVFIAPNGVESESFRTLRSTLAFSERSSECVAISSSEPGDGKTTVLSNLGVASAQAGKRTLLIDADMRRPGLTRLFNLRGKGGLSEVLRARTDVSTLAADRIQSTEMDGLDVLPCGPIPTDPSGLLANDRFAELLEWACDRYDLVLIDTPPILAASDASIVGRLTQGIVLVVQPSKNHRRLVHRAVDEIRATSLDVVGVVVNRISQGPDTDYGYNYGYGQGYGHGYHDDEAEAAENQEAEDQEAEDAVTVPFPQPASSNHDRPSSPWGQGQRAA